MFMNSYSASMEASVVPSGKPSMINSGRRFDNKKSKSLEPSR